MFKKYLPSADTLRRNRLLRPLARHLDQRALWRISRRGVAGGVAVGLFFGILVPFMQIFLAAAAAIALRVNLPVAALCTLVTNPLTFPPIYYLAYRIGDAVTGSLTALPEVAASLPEAGLDGWLSQALAWVQSFGLPLAAGLAILACGSAAIGYGLVQLAWRLRRWRRPRRATSA
ncbi:DUF2062 domain-containing protein [Noviherbaspirillum aridicola]|uniref:DUF2062 domain-containing protein n=1 Tax=Noviherbaspirillum aridicola TaxID=2849687 RepID=A0ABQ4Q927_9BURK|nr:DUF2062 domain-containing protein [Noviherbaspirillum aridicola]GIZ53716.1 hypothetical protein NCCP691_37300 [Noviherbaspirillum aridicola]